MVSTRSQLKKKQQSDRNNPVKRLPPEIMRCVWKQLGKSRYRFVTPVDKAFRESYSNRTELLEQASKDPNVNENKERNKETTDDAFTESNSCFTTFFAECDPSAAIAKGIINALAHRGDLDNLEILYYEYGYSFDSETSMIALNGYGGPEVFKWLHRRDCPWHIDTSLHLARSGNFKLLRWAIRRECPWHDKVCPTAIMYGRLDILKWAVRHGCPYDRQLCLFCASLFEEEGNVDDDDSYVDDPFDVLLYVLEEM